MSCWSSLRNRRGYFASLSLIIILLLAGCQGRGAQVPDSTAFPAPVKTWPLAGDPDTHWRLSSVFTASYGQATARQSMRALVTLERSGDSLNIVALTPIGLPLFSARLDANGTLGISQQVAAGPDPARVLAELQLCLWPAAQLRDSYDNGWTLVESAAGRTLKQGDLIITTVHWEEDVQALDLRRRAALPVTLHHHRQDYEIRIQPLKADTR